MSAAKSFAKVPDFLADMAAAAPGGQAAAPAVSQAEPVAAEPAPQAPAAAQPVAEQPAAAPTFKLPVKEATQGMSFNCPKTLYDELRNFMKMTDIPMSDILVEGARKELAFLKKKYGMEGK